MWAMCFSIRHCQKPSSLIEKLNELALVNGGTACILFSKCELSAGGTANVISRVSEFLLMPTITFPREQCSSRNYNPAINSSFIHISFERSVSRIFDIRVTVSIPNQ